MGSPGFSPGPLLVEEEIKKQLTLLEISESIHLARQALAEEEKLKTMPPKSGTVAVFYFKDTSADRSFRHLQKAMATMIIADLSQVSSLQVLERLRVQFLLSEMQLGQTGIVEETTAPRYGHLLGAENLIVGTMEPGSLRVKTSVASTSKKDVVGSIAVGSEIEEFYILQKEIVYNILKLLRVKFTSLEEMKFSQYHTKNLKAVTYFGQGLEAFTDLAFLSLKQNQIADLAPLADRHLEFPPYDGGLRLRGQREFPDLHAFSFSVSLVVGKSTSRCLPRATRRPRKAPAKRRSSARERPCACWTTSTRLRSS